MNKKKLFRSTTLLLALCMLLSCLMACKDKTEDEAPTGDKGENTYVDSNGWVYVSPDVNYGGEEFNIYTWSATDEWVLELNEGTTPIDSKTFYHLSNVEDELGVDFRIAQSVSGGWGAHTDFIAKVAMLSGDDKIDLVCQYSLAAIYGVLQGLYADLNQVEYINWNAPYWSQEQQEINTLNGKMFYCTGELSRSVIYNMFAMSFNYDLAAKYSMGDLYDLVDEGTWTVAKMKELSQDVYGDLNTNDVADAGDLYGLVIPEVTYLDPMGYGCDIPLLKTSDIGELEVNQDLYTQYGSDVVEALIGLSHNNEGAYLSLANGITYHEAISKNNAVFQVVTVQDIIKRINSSEVNYGILPMPKYNEQQENYYTALGMVYNMFSIPVVAPDCDKSAAVLEALAHDGYSYLTPYLYDQCIKSRYSRRPEDAEMFDILRDGIVYDPGRVLTNVEIFTFIRSSVAGQESVSTRYQRKLDIFTSALADVNFAFS